jgi:hypothetical protein
LETDGRDETGFVEDLDLPVVHPQELHRFEALQDSPTTLPGRRI